MIMEEDKDYDNEQNHITISKISQKSQYKALSCMGIRYSPLILLDCIFVGAEETIAATDEILVMVEVLPFIFLCCAMLYPAS